MPWKQPWGKWLLLRSKSYLLLGDPHVVSDIGKHRGLNEESLSTQPLASAHSSLGALSHTVWMSSRILLYCFLSICGREST